MSAPERTSPPHFLRVAASLALVGGSLAACAAATSGSGDAGADGSATDSSADSASTPDAAPTAPACTSASVAGQPCPVLNETCPPGAMSSCVPTFLVCQTSAAGTQNWIMSGCAEGPLPPPELAA